MAMASCHRSSPIFLASTASFFEPGTRGFVLALADRHPTPSSSKTSMTGYWKADNFLYGYFDTSLFTRICVPDSSGFAGSSKVHMAAGLCRDRRKLCAMGRCQCATTSALAHRAASSSSRTA